MPIDIEGLIEEVRRRVRQRHAPCDIPRAAGSNPTASWTIDIDFGRNGNSTDFIRSGFSNTENEVTWIDGDAALLELPQPPTGNDMLICADLVPHLSPTVVHQTVRLMIGGELAAIWVVNQPGRFNAILFARHFEEQRQPVLTIEVPDGFAPASIGSADQRILSVAIRSLRLQGLNPS